MKQKNLNIVTVGSHIARKTPEVIAFEDKVHVSRKSQLHSVISIWITHWTTCRR